MYTGRPSITRNAGRRKEKTLPLLLLPVVTETDRKHSSIGRHKSRL
jgi:hypothetical protein